MHFGIRYLIFRTQRVFDLEFLVLGTTLITFTAFEYYDSIRRLFIFDTFCKQ